MKSKNVSDLDYDELISEHFQIDKSETTHCSAWVNVTVLNITVDMLFVLMWLIPLFSKRVAIILRKEEIHFVLMEVYVEHLHAFQVQEIDILTNCFCIV